MLKVTDNGVIIPIKVVPKSAKNEIVGWENQELKIRLNALPEKGEANQTLIAFLSKHLKLPKSALEILSGETSRHKKVLILSKDLPSIQQKLQVEQ